MSRRPFGCVSTLYFVLEGIDVYSEHFFTANIVAIQNALSIVQSLSADSGLCDHCRSQY